MFEPTVEGLAMKRPLECPDPFGKDHKYNYYLLNINYLRIRLWSKYVFLYPFRCSKKDYRHRLFET